MSDWTWDTQEAAAAWMVVPTGDAGLGLQVCLYLLRLGHPTSFSQLHSSQARVLSLVANAVPCQGAPSALLLLLRLLLSLLLLLLLLRYLLLCLPLLAVVIWCHKWLEEYWHQRVA